MEKIEAQTEELKEQKAPMLNAFFRIHDYLVAHSTMPIRRQLMDEINWDDRLIAIKGGRGVGKTDFLLTRIKTGVVSRFSGHKTVLRIRTYQDQAFPGELQDSSGIPGIPLPETAVH